MRYGSKVNKLGNVRWVTWANCKVRCKKCVDNTKVRCKKCGDNTKVRCIFCDYVVY